MTDSNVLRALQNSVKGAVTASSLPELPIAFIGRNFKKPDDGKWLELIFLPNNQDETWGEDVQFRGIFRILLHWPIDDKGVYEPLDLASELVDFYQKSQALHAGVISVQIIRKPFVAGVIKGDASNAFPISLEYQNLQI